MSSTVSQPVFEKWVQKNYGSNSRTKTVTSEKYAKICKMLRGDDSNTSSKFRFWVRNKGFRLLRHDSNANEVFDDPNGDLYVSLHAKEDMNQYNGASIETFLRTNLPAISFFRKVALIEDFYDIIKKEHVDSKGQHAGQKKTYRLVSDLYAFLPREVITFYLLNCENCKPRIQKCSSLPNKSVERKYGEDLSCMDIIRPICSSTVCEKVYLGGNDIGSRHLYKENFKRDMANRCYLYSRRHHDVVKRNNPYWLKRTGTFANLDRRIRFSPELYLGSRSKLFYGGSPPCAPVEKIHKSVKSRERNYPYFKNSHCIDSNFNLDVRNSDICEDNFSSPFTSSDDEITRGKRTREKNWLCDDAYFEMSEPDVHKDLMTTKDISLKGTVQNFHDSVLNRLDVMCARDLELIDGMNHHNRTISLHNVISNASGYDLESPSGQTDLDMKADDQELRKNDEVVIVNGGVAESSIETRDDRDDIDDDDDDDEDSQKDQLQAGVNPERLKAFNMFVRLFIDENLDRLIPISKQPKETINAIILSCQRQFPEFSDRARKRIRTYLKSCRRSLRLREPTTQPTISRLSSSQLPEVNNILAKACQNESHENSKRQKLDIEASDSDTGTVNNCCVKRNTPPVLPSFISSDAKHIAVTHAEIVSVKALIDGYRQSASFLHRSADELERMLKHCQKAEDNVCPHVDTVPDAVYTEPKRKLEKRSVTPLSDATSSSSKSVKLNSSEAVDKLAEDLVDEKLEKEKVERKSEAKREVDEVKIESRSGDTSKQPAWSEVSSLYLRHNDSIHLRHVDIMHQRHDDVIHQRNNDVIHPRQSDATHQRYHEVTRDNVTLEKDEEEYHQRGKHNFHQYGKAQRDSPNLYTRYKSPQRAVEMRESPRLFVQPDDFASPQQQQQQSKRLLQPCYYANISSLKVATSSHAAMFAKQQISPKRSQPLLYSPRLVHPRYQHLTPRHNSNNSNNNNNYVFNFEEGGFFENRSQAQQYFSQQGMSPHSYLSPANSPLTQADMRFHEPTLHSADYPYNSTPFEMHKQ